MENFTIKRPSAQNYCELMDLLDVSFNFCDEGNKFINLLPKLYKKEYKPWDNNICVEANGRLYAGVGLYYSEFNVCGKKLKYGGIGNVAVHPDARKKGYMIHAMNYAIDEMKNNGTDFSVLDGQRQRYRYFGYDNAGTSYNFNITKTNLYHAYGVERLSDLTVEKLSKDDTAALDVIYNLNNKRKVYSIRNKESLFDLLCSWLHTPYKLCRNGKTEGYFVMGSGNKEICEFGVINNSDLKNAVISIVDSNENNGVYFKIPSYETELCDFFYSICDYAEVKGSCKISVFNYKNTIEAFLSLKCSIQSVPDCSFSCLIHGIAGDEKLLIGVKDGKAYVEAYNGEPDIELSHIDAVNFFFDNFNFSLRESISPSAKLMLPLPYYIQTQDHV